MKFYRITVLFILIAFIASGITNAQVKKTTGWKSPLFTIDILPVYALPLQETKGNSIGDFFAFKNYGTKYGWGGQFNFKFGLGPQGQYRPYLTLGYSQFQNSDNSVAYIRDNLIDGGYPNPDKTSIPIQGTPGQGSSEIFLRIPYIGAGFEYAVTTVDRKKRKWYPYFGVEFLLSVISGIYRQTSNEAPGPNSPGVETGYTIKTDVRMGIGGGLGAAIRIGKFGGISFGGKYKLFNLIGKKSDFLKEQNKMNLLDKSDADLHNLLSKDRNIGTIEFYAGFTLFLGKTKK
jgi:hypothetical protein